MLSPLGKVAKYQKQFLTVAALYTFGGLISSSLVGLAIAGLGRLLLGSGDTVFRLGILLTLAAGILALARELFFPKIPLLQAKRQTPYRWLYAFKLELTAFLWGFDLGTIFSTYVTFSGIWPLTIGVFTTASPAVGAAIFAAYWLGKAATIWSSPYWVEDDHSADEVSGAISKGRPMLKLVHTAGIVSILLGSVVMLYLWR